MLATALPDHLPGRVPRAAYSAAGRLVAAEGAIFTYDKNGNLTSKTTASGKTTYTWDIENRLARVELPDRGTVSYRYDPFGRRIEKNVNGAVTTYLYDGNAILMEMDGAGQVTARYTHGPVIDWPLMMERKGQTFFYHADALRSVAALTDSSGNVVRSYAYDSWGRPQGTEPAGPANPFLFAGCEYDVETGLCYLRARCYDPATGRFISSDPLDIAGLLLTAQDPAAGFALLPASAAVLASDVGTGLLRAPQQLNPYSYALNNPIALRDPSGLQPCTPWQRFQQAENEWSSQFEQQLKGSMQLEADQWTEWWQSFKEAYKESFKTDWSKMGPSEHLREILKFLKTGGTGRAGR